MHDENTTATHITQVRSIATTDLVSAITLAHDEWKRADKAARGANKAALHRDAGAWQSLRSDLKSRATAGQWNAAVGAFCR